MGFMDSFKRLEKLCGEIYRVQHGVSAYIEDMEKCSSGAYSVEGWSEDLRRLKDYLHLRNKIGHDTDFSEDDCDEGDAEWLDSFRSRIMNRDDPLARYPRFMDEPKKKRTATVQTRQATPSSYRPRDDVPPSRIDHTWDDTNRRCEKPSRWSEYLFNVILYGSAILLAVIIGYCFYVFTRL